VLAPVLENVDESATDLARRRQRAHMVPIGPNFPAASQHSIGRFRNADREALDPAPQDQVSLRFDE